MILNYRKWKTLYEQAVTQNSGQPTFSGNVIDGVTYMLPKIKDINSLNAFISVPSNGDVAVTLEKIIGQGHGDIFKVGAPEMLGSKVFGSLTDLLRIHAASGKTVPYSLDDNLKKVAEIKSKNGHGGINANRLNDVIDFMKNPKNKEYLGKYTAFYTELLKNKLQG
jgi:hypothetical protein